MRRLYSDSAHVGSRGLPAQLQLEAERWRIAGRVHRQILFFGSFRGFFQIGAARSNVCEAWRALDMRIEPSELQEPARAQARAVDERTRPVTPW